jgi:hypothetical protein
MAVISSATDGIWSSTATWSGGVIPGANDTAQVLHKVTIDRDIAVAGITLAGGGSLFVNDSGAYSMGPSCISIDCPVWRLEASFYDSGRVMADQATLLNVRPSISCYTATNGDYLTTKGLFFDSDVANPLAPSDGMYTMIETGLPSYSRQMSDQSGEGQYWARSRPVSGNPRSLTVTVRWPRPTASSGGTPSYSETLRRMSMNPYPVLVASKTTIFKGFIETLQYVDITKSHYTATLTIVEA